jgi:hypothetical protein
MESKVFIVVTKSDGKGSGLSVDGRKKGWGSSRRRSGGEGRRWTCEEKVVAEGGGRREEGKGKKLRCRIRFSAIKS